MFLLHFNKVLKTNTNTWASNVSIFIGIITGHALVLSCPNPWKTMVPNVSARYVRVYAFVASHSIFLSGVDTSMFASTCHTLSLPHWHRSLEEKSFNSHFVPKYFYIEESMAQNKIYLKCPYNTDRKEDMTTSHIFTWIWNKSIKIRKCLSSQWIENKGKSGYFRFKTQLCG